MTAFVNGTARSSPAARTSSTASSVTAWPTLAPAELVRAEPQRRDHRRVELPHRPLAELLDPEVDRPRPLHRAVGEPLRERAIAVVEPATAEAKRSVGVGLLLEHPPHDLVRGAPGRRDHRNPRTNSS